MTLPIQFRKTDKQRELIKLLGRKQLHTMVFGGSRSGKTFGLVFAIVVRALKCAGSRHVIARRNLNSVMRSIFLDTFPKVMRAAFPNVTYKSNASYHFVTFPNGSELWFAGLDNDETLDKILGQEFSTIYFNECSEISYQAIQLLISRLAQKNELAKKVYYDENPPTTAHWSYALFIQKLNPVDREPLDNPDNYAVMQINPRDNLDNIDPAYLEILKGMPLEQRTRFLDGNFADNNNGNAYFGFDIVANVQQFETPIDAGTIYLGQDFNVDPMAGVAAFMSNDVIYIFDELFLRNSSTLQAARVWREKGYAGGVIVPDSTGRNRKSVGLTDFKILHDEGFEIIDTRNPRVNDRVMNFNYRLMQQQVVIHPRCKKLIYDLQSVKWDKNGNLDQTKDKLLTHISDAAGYILWRLMPLIDNQKSRIING